MRNFIMAAVAVAALASSGVAMADEFSGPQSQSGVNAYLNQQSTDAQDSDTTAPDSVRSHGHP